ncbi:DUF1178 family protein [Acidisphaera sp. L21]|uniref:DUF1178 family protein n=1 Tax=Acidisphaera sp. L21 TaxID=1641851 RepID=UPI00131D69BC|nr:DUF1178 family protein [Acidisphaera sp. L21]
MIHYQLRCDGDHAFDGWFRDSASFDKQAKAGLLSCPVCGGVDVRRALMSPAVGKKRAAPAQIEITASVPVVPKAAPVAGGANLPDELRALLQRMRAEVEKRCDYVGNGFANEARRIHNGESEARGIYGEATPEEAERLADDGIEIAQIPWVPRADG